MVLFREKIYKVIGGGVGGVGGGAPDRAYNGCGFKVPCAFHTFLWASLLRPNFLWLPGGLGKYDFVSGIIDYL